MTSCKTMIINGEARVVEIAPFETLAELLRSLGLTGTKIGCAAGDCGSCTVHCNGRAVLGCQILATEATSPVTTIEALNDAGAVALRQAFAEQGAFQCGFCTSGQIMQAHALLASADWMDDRMLARALSGNIRRCTGYAGILRAIRAAALALVHDSNRHDVGTISEHDLSGGQDWVE